MNDRTSPVESKVNEAAAVRYFVHDNDCGYEEFDTDEARDKAHQAAIDGYLDDGWSEEVTSVVSGIVTHVTVKTNEERRPQPCATHPEHDDENCEACVAWNEYPNHDFDTCCSYVPESIAAPQPAQADAREGLTDEQREAIKFAASWFDQSVLPDTPYAGYSKALRALLATHPGQPGPRAEADLDSSDAAAWEVATLDVPADEREVLVFLNGDCALCDWDGRKGGGWGICLGYYDHEKRYWRVHGCREHFVTHWQDLPDAPPTAAANIAANTGDAS